MEKTQENLKLSSFGEIKNMFERTYNYEVDQNRFEALVVLSQTLFKEIEILKQDRNKYSEMKINLADEVENYEASLIRCALMRTGGNQRAAAQLLNVKITTLNNKIKKMGILNNGLAVDFMDTLEEIQ